MSERRKAESPDDAGEANRVDIPDGVVVECPMVGKKLRAVKLCAACEHHAGLAERFAKDGVSFSVRYQVACRFPFARAIMELEQVTDDAGTQ